MISRSIIHFAGETIAKSTLTNVKIHVLQENRYLVGNSSMFKFPNSTAIACYGSCPYVKNLNISGFAIAVEIRNNGNIFLSDIHIKNCFYGVLATNIKVNGPMAVKNNHSEGYRYMELLRLEKIIITNTRVGVLLEDHSSLPIELEEIAIENCYYGMVISKTLFTRVMTSKLTLENGVHALILKTTPGHFQHVDICDGSNSIYNGSYPVEITYNGYNSNRCAMVSWYIL